MDITRAGAAAAKAHEAALRSIAREVTETGPLQDAGTASQGVLGLFEVGGVLALTGAGVSTDSGIPDYRGPQGAWRTHRPMTYQEFRHDPSARHRYWARSFVGWRHLNRAEPNRAHRLLASFEADGVLTGVVTQNVDGLHAAAGSHRLVTLHGDLGRVICLHCGATEPRESVDERLEQSNPGLLQAARADPAAVNPDGDVELSEKYVADFRMIGCLVCGSDELKPDVVYFGESVPPERKAAVSGLLADSSSVLVLGSSLAVMSGFRIVLDAVAQGKPVAIVNDGPSRADGHAAFRWRARVAPSLAWIRESLGTLGTI